MMKRFIPFLPIIGFVVGANLAGLGYVLWSCGQHNKQIEQTPQPPTKQVVEHSSVGVSPRQMELSQALGVYERTCADEMEYAYQTYTRDFIVSTVRTTGATRILLSDIIGNLEEAMDKDGRVSLNFIQADSDPTYIRYVEYLRNAGYVVARDAEHEASTRQKNIEADPYYIWIHPTKQALERPDDRWWPD